MNKEQIYDEQINPLLQQIINICQKHGIAMIADFAIPTEENKGLHVMTALGDETGRPPLPQLLAFRIIQGEFDIMAIPHTQDSETESSTSVKDLHTLAHRILHGDSDTTATSSAQDTEIESSTPTPSKTLH
jgi:hypothetical protein